MAGPASAPGRHLWQQWTAQPCWETGQSCAAAHTAAAAAEAVVCAGTAWAAHTAVSASAAAVAAAALGTADDTHASRAQPVPVWAATVAVAAQDSVSECPCIHS